ncbi:LacI family DNA-binding transcriptional regulator [Couchioplanes azureus]|uniref:LacI family DNA-binding transcriptional regulator n=1 Tax=Couchioplanes caeruleus TaxID=56438 RepID=UPI00166F8B29|nr:LacI family DNA-binding transcriptional regulator [Couchioplanes caeruleus]
MNDVARRAGVSLKTVSRVVNGETTVDPALAARVRAAVAALGYRPNLGASLLRRNDRRTGTIGLLLDDSGDPFSALLHRAVEDEARARGVDVLTGSLDDDPVREQELATAFARRHADGLILAPVAPDQGYLARELHPGTPVVFVHRPAAGYRADTVLATDRSGAAAATRHLLDHGHRRIAFLGAAPRIATARSRRQGYRDAMREAGLPTCEAVARESRSPAVTAALLALAEPPTALFAAQRRLTVGALRALRRAGLHRRVALVGFDDLPLADLLEPALTVVAEEPAVMGRAAACALFERIEGHNGEPREIAIPTTLTARGSGELRPVGE